MKNSMNFLPSLLQQARGLIDEQFNVELVGPFVASLFDGLVRALGQVDLRKRYLLVLLISRVFPEEDDSSVQHGPISFPGGIPVWRSLVEQEQEAAVLDVYSSRKRRAVRDKLNGSFQWVGHVVEVELTVSGRVTIQSQLSAELELALRRLVSGKGENGSVSGDAVGFRTTVSRVGDEETANFGSQQRSARFFWSFVFGDTL